MSETPQTIPQFYVAMHDVCQLVANVGRLVKDQIETALETLITGDAEKVRVIERKEAEVDALEKEVDKACTEILARFNPVATDLRMVIVILKTITDMERIGDEAMHIAEQSSISDKIPKKIQDGIKSLGDEVLMSLKQLLENFGDMDADHEAIDLKSSRSIVAADKAINTHADDLIESVLSDGFGESSEGAQTALASIWCIRSLERIGDHIKNVSQYLIYFSEGVDIRHSRK